MSRQWQYAFRDGHFVDTWNEGVNDESECWNADQGVTWPEMVLEICACGEPEDVVDAMGEYLARVEESSNFDFHPFGFMSIRDGEHRLADLLLAYFSADRNLTEHGSSVYGAWLTAAGKRWLELWRATALGDASGSGTPDSPTAPGTAPASTDD